MVSRQCYVVFIASATNILLYYYYVVATCIFNLSLYKSCHFQIIREIGFTRHYTNTDLSKISIPFLSCQKTSEHKHSWFLNPHSHLHYPLKMTYTKMKLFSKILAPLNIIPSLFQKKISILPDLSVKKCQWNGFCPPKMPSPEK